MRNQKGFTLVELLAVIVILAVVMLIAATTFGPVISGTQKSALRTEALGLSDAAQMAYQLLQSDGQISANDTVCFTSTYLNGKGYFEKGESDGYKGSVMIKPDNSASGKFVYTVWLTNGVYGYDAIQSPNYGSAEGATDYSASYNYENCGGNAVTKTL